MSDRSGVSKADIRVMLVSSQVANRLAVRHHYLHRRRVGKVVSYAVLYRNLFEGIIIFAWPPVCHPMFGYKPGEIVELARLWMENNLRNAASCAIRQAVKELRKDWPEAKAVVSWCDRSRFDGAVYKATGFEFVGKSRTRGKDGGRAGRNVQADRLTPKDVYLLRVQ